MSEEKEKKQSHLERLQNKEIADFKKYLDENPGEISAIILTGNTLKNEEDLKKESENQEGFLIVKTGNGTTLGLMLGMFLIDNMKEPFVKIALEAFKSALNEQEKEK